MQRHLKQIAQSVIKNEDLRTLHLKTAGNEAVPLDTLAEIIINTAVRL
jgi:hypothetical protein